MRKWVIIVIAAVVILVGTPVIVALTVFSPFIGMAMEIDELNSMDGEEMTTNMMQHPAAQAYVAEYTQYESEFSNLGVGGTELILKSDDAQLTLFYDADGNSQNAIYICFLPDGGAESIDGPDVAQRIGTLC